ncbi:MAG: hypothetical protein ACMXYF_00135 [Candidatus Woesearchaeota archaeon]
MFKKELINVLFLLLLVVLAFWYFGEVNVDDQGRAISAYDPFGQPMKTESVFSAVFLIPILAVLLYTFIIFLSEIAVHKPHLDRFFAKFFSFKLIVIFLFFAVYLSKIFANQQMLYMEQWILIPAVAIGFWYVGHMFEHLKGDYFAPWIRNRSQLWEDTHIIGEWLFKICAILILFALFVPDLLFVFLVVPLVAVLLMIFVYSFVIFSKEHAHHKHHEEVMKLIHKSHDSSTHHVVSKAATPQTVVEPEPKVAVKKAAKKAKKTRKKAAKKKTTKKKKTTRKKAVTKKAAAKRTTKAAKKTAKKSSTTKKAKTRKKAAKKTTAKRSTKVAKKAVKKASVQKKRTSKKAKKAVTKKAAKKQTKKRVTKKAVKKRR